MSAETESNIQPAPLPASKRARNIGTLAELAEADQLIAALGDAFPVPIERRKTLRERYQSAARLELEGASGAQSPTLHTRDVDIAGAGFVTTTDLSENERAVLHLPAPDGQTHRIPCTVRRAREVVEGWYEGSVEFDTAELPFSREQIEIAADADDEPLS